MDVGEFTQTIDDGTLIRLQAMTILTLRAEVERLSAVLATYQDQEQRVEIPSTQKGRGKLPWHLLRHKLEIASRPKEVINSLEENQEDAI